MERETRRQMRRRIRDKGTDEEMERETRRQMRRRIRDKGTDEEKEERQGYR